MDMRVLFHYEGVTTLVTDCVECLSFSNHIYFITRMGQELAASDAHMILKLIRTVPEHAQQYEGHQNKSTAPWGCISYGFWAWDWTLSMIESHHLGRERERERERDMDMKWRGDSYIGNGNVCVCVCVWESKFWRFIRRASWGRIKGTIWCYVTWTLFIGQTTFL